MKKKLLCSTAIMLACTTALSAYTQDVYAYTYNKDFISRQGVENLGKADVVNIAFHETGNWHPNADAQGNAGYFSDYERSKAIVQFIADDEQVIQLAPIDTINWHLGINETGTTDITFNNTIGIEICVNVILREDLDPELRDKIMNRQIILHFEDGWDKDRNLPLLDYKKVWDEEKSVEKYERALSNAIVFVGEVVKEQYPHINIVKHQDYSNKYCPRRILDMGRWGEIIDRVNDTEMNERDRANKITNYISNVGDVMYFDDYVNGVTNAPVTPEVVDNSSKIIGYVPFDKDKAMGLVLQQNPSPKIYDLKLQMELIDKYAQKYDINPEVVFGQEMQETGWYSFQYDVQPEQNNFAGLGAIGNGERGNYYKNQDEGVEAQVQHLWRYSHTGNFDYPIVDQRWDNAAHLAGTIFTVQGMAGKWATDPNYASGNGGETGIEKIIRQYRDFVVTDNYFKEEEIPAVEEAPVEEEAAQVTQVSENGQIEEITTQKTALKDGTYTVKNLVIENNDDIPEAIIVKNNNKDKIIVVPDEDIIYLKS